MTENKKNETKQGGYFINVKNGEFLHLEDRNTWKENQGKRPMPKETKEMMTKNKSGLKVLELTISIRR